MKIFREAENLPEPSESDLKNEHRIEGGGQRIQLCFRMQGRAAPFGRTARNG